MSSCEYYDLFQKCKNENSIYHIFTFDLVNSKLLTKEELCDAEKSLVSIINHVYILIKLIEKDINKKILIDTEDLDFGITDEPFKLGDMVGITIYNNTITKEALIKLFDTVKVLHNFKYDLHYGDGFYETNSYKEGNKKLYRGYAIDIVSNMHKNNR